MPALHRLPIVAVSVFIVVAVVLEHQNIAFDLPTAPPHLVAPLDDIALSQGLVRNPRPAGDGLFPLAIGPGLLTDDEMHIDPTALAVKLEFV